MKTPPLFLTIAIFLCQLCAAMDQSEVWGDGSSWTKDSILPDFSFVGYRQGSVPLPEVQPEVSVADFGAVGDGEMDSTEAFKLALQKAAGKTISIPKGVYILSDRLLIGSPGTVLVGKSREDTILHFTKGLQEIEPTSAVAGGGIQTNSWSWSGGVITLGKSRGSDVNESITIEQAAKRGDTHIQVADASGLKEGEVCRIEVVNKSENSLVDYLYRGRPGDISLIGKSDFSISQVVIVDSIEGNRVTLQQGLRFDLRPEWEPSFFRFVNPSQEIGIANVTIRFPPSPYRGHWMEDGLNGIEIRGVNNWARSIRIQNCDSGIFVNGAWCTVEGVVIESAREPHESENTGHHGITMKGRECLVNDFSIETKFFHDLTVTQGSIGNVFSQGRAVDMAIDNHRAAPYENLFTQLDVGEGSRVWLSGGTTGKGLNSAAGGTFWNIDSKKRFALPAENFGPPGLIFVGLNTESVRKSELPDGWHYERISPAKIEPQNLYLAQVKKRQSGTTLTPSQKHQLYTWTNQKGAKIEAVFLSLEGDTIKMRLNNGREFVYPLADLDEESQSLAKLLGVGYRRTSK